MDGRSGSSSMRLTFAGVPEEEIREGIRRIGKAVREQLGLFGSLTGSARPAASGDRSEIEGTATAEGGGQAEGDPAPAAEGSAQLADVVALPRRDDAASTRRRRDR
jgi:hypothetical protein